MNPNIPRDLFPETLLVEVSGGKVFTTSLKVAEHFGKRHSHVLCSIEKLIADIVGLKSGDPNLSRQTEGSLGIFTKRDAFSQPNFGLAEYRDAQGKPRSMYHLTHDGFALLAMGFTGRAALAWKVRFLDAFHAIEHQLAEREARYARALSAVRPCLVPVTEAFEAGLSRAVTGAVIGKSARAVTYHRRAARRLGLIDTRASDATDSLGLKPEPQKRSAA